MAKLPRATVLAIAREMFRYDLNDLDEAYANSLHGIESQGGEIEAMVRSKLGLDPSDEFPDPDLDDPDDPIALLYEHAGELDQQTRRSAHIVRKAFLISLFHLWERHHMPPPVKSLGKEQRRRLFSKLNQLRLAANTAKHTPGPSAEKLFKLRPDLFPRLASGRTPSESLLVISPDVLNEFFEAVWSTIEETRRPRSTTGSA